MDQENEHDDDWLEDEDEVETECTHTDKKVAAEEEESSSKPVAPTAHLPPAPAAAAAASSTTGLAHPRQRKPANRRHHETEIVDEEDDAGSGKRARVPPPTPARPKQRLVQVVVSKKKSFISTVLPTVCFVVGLAMIAVVILAKLDFGNKPPSKKMPSMFYELTDDVWPKQCTPVTIEEMEAGKVHILSKEVKLADVRDSLIHHIQQREEGGLCAQNLERKSICYCILATNSTSKPYLEIYNMMKTGDSFPNMELIPEENTFCKHPVDKLRYTHVTVRFHRPDGKADRQEFDAPDAYVIQAFDDMLRGVSRCEDTKEEMMIHDVHDGVRYLTKAEMFKEYGHLARAYPEGLLPDVHVEDRRKRQLPSSK